MNKITLSAITAILTSLVVLGGVQLTEDKVYYCEDKSIVMHCDKLSSTERTCYNSQVGNKLCGGTWKQVVQDTPEIKVNTKEWLCSPEGCVAKNGG